MKQFKNEVKEQKGGYLSILLGKLDASLLVNLLTGKKAKKSNIPGRGVMTTGQGKIRADERIN